VLSETSLWNGEPQVLQVTDRYYRANHDHQDADDRAELTLLPAGKDDRVYSAELPGKFGAGKGVADG